MVRAHSSPPSQSLETFAFQDFLAISGNWNFSFGNDDGKTVMQAVFEKAMQGKETDEKILYDIVNIKENTANAIDLGKRGQIGGPSEDRVA